VIEVLEKRVYKLELPKAMAMHPVFHIAQLRKYKDPQEFPERPKKQIKTDYTNGNKRKQIVEVKEKRVKKERVQYLVKWEEVDELIWVPARNLEYTHKQILEFEKANGKKKDEEEEVNKPVVEKKKSKKSTGQKEMKALLD
jgi:hypothetical protein